MAPRSASYEIEDFVANMLPRVADRDINLLIGHSLGVPVSLGLYSKLKTKPERLVLVDPVRLYRKNEWRHSQRVHSPLATHTI
jgi:predicted alpha/beta hydrolase family esterase